MIVHELLNDLLVAQARYRRPPTTEFQHRLASPGRSENHTERHHPLHGVDYQEAGLLVNNAAHTDVGKRRHPYRSEPLCPA